MSSYNNSPNNGQQPPKYDMRINPVYQIDFQATAKGKRVSATKKRVAFKFGFSNAKALQEGMTGTHCRGEEHEVNFVWSLTSGKRIIHADGEEVHYSQGKRGESRFEASWTMFGNHVLKIVAHAAPAVFSKDVRFRQFDLLVDGMSFFDMAKVFELGVVSADELARRRHLPPAGMPTTPRSRSFGGAVDYYDNSYGAGYGNDGSFGENTGGSYGGYESSPGVPNAFAPSPSMRRSTVHRGPSMDDRSDRSSYLSPAASAGAPQRSASFQTDMLSDPVGVQDYISAPAALIDQAPPAPIQAQVVAPAPMPTHVHQPVQQGPPAQTLAPVQTVHTGPMVTPQKPPVAAAPYGATTDEFAPVAPPPATFADKASEILGAYGPAPATPALPALPYEPANPEHGASPVAATGGTFHSSPSFSDSASGATATLPTSSPENEAPITPEVSRPPLTMNSPVSVLDIDAPKNQMEKALHQLVNLDDITETNASPEQRKVAQKKEEAMKTAPKSHGLPPTAPAWHLGTAPSLNDIKHHAPEKPAAAKDVMRMHAFDPAAAQGGMMVVYGAAATPPPPPAHAYGIPAAAGFGAAVGLHQQYQHQHHQPSYAAH